MEAHFATPVKAVRIDTQPIAEILHFEYRDRRPFLLVYDSNHQVLGTVYYAGTLPTTGIGATETLTFVSTSANIAYARFSCEFRVEDAFHYRADFDNLRFDDFQAGPNYVVNTTDDHDDGTPGDSDCTLREAINEANSRPGAQTITFAPNVTGAISLVLGELVINGDVTIIGPGATVLAVSGNNSSRVFKATAGTVQISGLAITGGRVTGQAGAPAPTPGGFGWAGSTVLGGGIFNQATLTLTDCWIAGNTVNCGAGGLGGASNGSVPPGMGGTGGSGYGGGVYNEGFVALIRCTISGNSVIAGTGGQGGAGYPLNFGNGGSGGVGGWADGGGVYSETNPTVNNCTFSGNSVVGGAGGAGGSGRPFQQGGAGGAGGNGRGGGMAIDFFGSSASCTFTSNSANAGAGGAGGSVGFGGTVGPAGTPGLAQGGGLRASSSIQIRNCLVAGNTGNDGPDCWGTFVSGGHNLIRIVDGASGFTSTGTRPAAPLYQSIPRSARFKPMADRQKPSHSFPAVRRLTLGRRYRGSPRISAASSVRNRSRPTSARLSMWPVGWG